MTYYQILQVDPSAEAELIHESWRRLMRRYHPDNRETGNAEKARVINEAHELLMDPQKRAAYDHELLDPQKRAGQAPEWGEPEAWGHVDPRAYPPGYVDPMAEMRQAAENAITNAVADIGSVFIRGAMKNASPMLRKIFEDALLKKGMPR